MPSKKGTTPKTDVLPRVLAMHAAGRTTHQIAAAVNKSKDTIRNYIKKYADNPPEWCEDYWKLPPFVTLRDHLGRAVYRDNGHIWDEAPERDVARAGVVSEPIPLLVWGR